MSGYTKGPWRFDEQMFEVVTDEEVLAEIVSVKDRSYTQNPPANHEVTLANAHLMAAAPELLEALKMVDEQAALDFSSKQIAQIQAAIAKAVGK